MLKANREINTQRMFETFDVPYFCMPLNVAQVLIMVMVFHVMPVYEGHALWHGTEWRPLLLHRQRQLVRLPILVTSDDAKIVRRIHTNYLVCL
jgi:hypothetical protein